MPARLIRDDMLDSERVQSLPIEARWLFVAVMLSADDVGLLELSPFKLGRRAALDQAVIPTLLQSLCDADLLRAYQVEGRAYGFIPRFRQRLQIKRTKCPLPPAALMDDDNDASSKINNLAKMPRMYNRAIPLSTVAQPPEPEPEPEPEANKHTPPPDGSRAGRVCLALRQAGIQATNPGHPTLLALLEAGATDAELTGLAPKAFGKGDPFAWLLGTAVKQRQQATTQAATMQRGAIGPAHVPDTRGADELRRQDEHAKHVVPPPEKVRALLATMRLGK